MVWVGRWTESWSFSQHYQTTPWATYFSTEGESILEIKATAGERNYFGQMGNCIRSFIHFVFGFGGSRADVYLLPLLHGIFRGVS